MQGHNLPDNNGNPLCGNIIYDITCHPAVGIDGGIGERKRAKNGCLKMYIYI